MPGTNQIARHAPRIHRDPNGRGAVARADAGRHAIARGGVNRRRERRAHGLGANIVVTEVNPIRALEAAIAVQLLCPQIPLIFMGEEDGSPSPFLFFTDHNPELAAVVRDGRRREFARFPAFADAAQRDHIPDPNDPQTFQKSIPRPDPDRAIQRRALYQRLLALRHTEIVPRLDGAHSLEADALGPAQIIEAVPEKLGPAPARNDQYIAVLDQRICHGASVLRPATHQDAAHRRCRPGWQLVDLIRHRAWCWSRHELDWSFGT